MRISISFLNVFIAFLILFRSFISSLLVFSSSSVVAVSHDFSNASRYIIKFLI